MKNYHVKLDGDIRNTNRAIQELHDMYKEIDPEDYERIEAERKIKRAEYLKQQREKKKKA